jgi:hypothetical protein
VKSWRLSADVSRPVREKTPVSLKLIAGSSCLTAKKTVVTLKFQDNATEFRVEIMGRFSGGTVKEVYRFWRTVVTEGDRLFAFDISKMAGYDSAGCALLRDMFRYGAKIVAATPESLVFLSEISRAVPERKRGSLLPGQPSGALT